MAPSFLEKLCTSFRVVNKLTLIPVSSVRTYGRFVSCGHVFRLLEVSWMRNY